MLTLKKFHTVLFSTVLKPTSEILGSFSPSSKVHKTLVASENIPRSVRTRTYNEIKKNRRKFNYKYKKLWVVKFQNGILKFQAKLWLFISISESWLTSPPPMIVRNVKMLRTIQPFSCIISLATKSIVFILSQSPFLQEDYIFKK